MGRMLVFSAKNHGQAMQIVFHMCEALLAGQPQQASLPSLVQEHGGGTAAAQ